MIIKKQCAIVSNELVCRKISQMVDCYESGNESYGFLNTGEFSD